VIDVQYTQRWGQANKTFHSVDQREKPFEYASLYLFRLVWKDVEPRRIFVNELLYEIFDDQLGRQGTYSFYLSQVKPKSKIIVEYIDDEGTLLKDSFFLSFHEHFFASDVFIEQQLQPLIGKWKQIARNMQVEGKKEVSYQELERKDWRDELEEILMDHPIFEEQKIIIGLLEQVCKQPKKQLTGKERLVHVSELDRVTPQTMEYFMREPSTWDYVPLQQPRPNRVMKEEIEESLDLYENRFIVTFIQLAIDIIISRQKSLEKKKSMAQSRIKSMDTRISYDIMAGYALSEKDELVTYEEMYDEEITALRAYKNKLRVFRNSFKELRPIEGYVRPNQVLVYDKNYAPLFRIYQRIKEIDSKKNKYEKEDVDFLSYYTDSLFFSYLQVLKKLGFENNEDLVMPISNDIEDYPFSRDEVTFRFSHEEKDQPYYVEITRHSLEAGATTGHQIQMKFCNETTGVSSKISIFPSVIAWNGLVEQTELQKIYHHLPFEQEEEELVSSMLAHTTGSNEFGSLIPYQSAHYLINLGANFINPDDWEAFGYFKKGMLPQIPGDEFSERAFTRLVHIHLFVLGFRDRCLVCDSEGESLDINNTEEAYRCSNPQCNMEWGISSCSSCHSAMLKMQKKIKGDVEQEEESELDKLTDMGWILEQEQKNAGLTLSNMCENHYRGNSFFAICPNCGQCQHENRKHKYCRRCDAKHSCLVE
jgi:hypothetical protein